MAGLAPPFTLETAAAKVSEPHSYPARLLLTLCCSHTGQESAGLVEHGASSSSRARICCSMSAWARLTSAPSQMDPEKVALAYTEDSIWRNRDQFFRGRKAIIDFLTQKWAGETQYKLRKQLHCFMDNQIAVNFW